MKQGEKTKRHILKQSDRLFYTKGYAHTSFDDIMRATGLSKGNITYHFKNKQTILEGIITQRLTEIEASFAHWEAQSQDPKERLMLFCDMIINESNNIARYGCPMGTLTAEFAKGDDALYKITLPLFEAYRQWLAKQYMLMGYESKASDEKAMSLLGRVQGVAMVAHSFKDKHFLVSEIEKIKSELLKRTSKSY
jgi:AcrR family transcriptional regulator